MNNGNLFTSDFKEAPYWWEAAPRPELPQLPLPKRVDVLVIGSGYTGLSAALQTARGGRETLVLDAEDAGWGCSSRNGGQVSTSIKLTLGELAAKYGHDHAFRMVQEGHKALAYIADFIQSENIDCDWERVGRFHAAHNSKQYEVLAKRVASQPKGLEVEAHMVPRSEQRQEIGTDAYYGGCVYPAHAALHPGRYHLALLDLVSAAGATVHARCRVNHIERNGKDFNITTSNGVLQARDVIVATNGYTDAVSSWQRRRVIPIGSYIIATEPIGSNLMSTLMPKARVLSDTRKLVYYYRSSPDRKRILFGGRVALKETNPRVSAPRLHSSMCEIFPELTTTRITHSWVGFVAYTFDTMPHTGVKNGIHYAMGYCGSGVSLGSYFGMRLGQRVLSTSEGRTALDDVPFPTRPLYTGNPWFLAPSILYYRMRDRMNI
ncbi:MAG: FAD-binding oxidoreductase [Gammaproteobacteria bacterium]|nr:FAD-binding oxidoreductase [Gammaproteobacteria bacterium]